MIAAMERSRPFWISAYRVAFGLLTVGTIIFLIIHNSSVIPDYEISNFLSFFTVQSNLLAAVVLLCGAFGLTDRWPDRVADLVRGAAVVYMATTGVVYGLLLVGYVEHLQTNVVWADTVVHRVIPIVLVVDWLIEPPRTRLTVRAALVWLWFPLAYVVYSLIRARIVDWYPYPFFDPDLVGGYAGVAVACAGIAAFILLMSWLTVMIGNAQRQFRQQATGLPGQPGNVESMV